MFPRDWYQIRSDPDNTVYFSQFHKLSSKLWKTVAHEDPDPTKTTIAVLVCKLFPPFSSAGFLLYYSKSEPLRQLKLELTRYRHYTYVDLLHYRLQFFRLLLHRCQLYICYRLRLQRLMIRRRRPVLKTSIL